MTKMYQKLPLYEQSLLKEKKSTEAMWRQFFHIEKYDLVNWQLEWNINTVRNKHYWKLNKEPAISFLETIT